MKLTLHNYIGFRNNANIKFHIYLEYIENSIIITQVKYEVSTEATKEVKY